MASRMIHYTVAEHMIDLLRIEDRNAFLVGSVIPDAWYLSNHKDKKQSHFMTVDEIKNIRGCDCTYFIKKYLSSAVNEFYLGYFIHLLMDNIFLTDIQAETVYSLPKDQRNGLTEILYEDNYIYNTKLINQYGYQLDLMPVPEIKLDEIDLSVSHQQLFLNEFYHDFEPVHYGEMKMLECSHLDQYIEKCIRICTENVKLIQHHQKCINLEQYMISNDIC